MRHSSLCIFRWAWLRPQLCLRKSSISVRTALTTSRNRPPSLNFPTLDAKWQDIWARNKLGKFDRKSNDEHGHPTHVLPMFPYPSGSLHMGHIRVYTISDVIARFNYMRGKNVVHPIGWDAFGLPAENAAIERGIDPAVWTEQNIDQMKKQLRSMNGVWDWDRVCSTNTGYVRFRGDRTNGKCSLQELRTCDPSYYKHTQRLFLMLYEAGLAYQKEALVNWDPIDQTVLANEQVDANGFSWRSGAKIEQRSLKQWFLATTHFVKQLHDDLQRLKDAKSWPSRVVDMQQNWIGRSSGVQFPFDLEVMYSRNEAARELLPQHRQVEVFTTRLDTLFGVQFIALSLKHPLVQAYAESDPQLSSFIERAATLPPDSKEGYLLPFAAKNSLLGVRRISVYAAPYVLDDYGTGAVMGVPAHNIRDNGFWRYHRKGEPLMFTVKPCGHAKLTPDKVWVDKGVVYGTGGLFDELDSDEAIQQIAEELARKDYNVVHQSRWKLRDWLVSRQRYWGAPIPIVHCESCGTVPVSPSDLPIQLPKLTSEMFKSRTGNPLQAIEEWVNTTCPKCKGPAKRETDTMDTFMDSAWYFFRFADPTNADEPFDTEVVKTVMPVDYYVGGVEHAILHLLYARFMSKFLASGEGKNLWPTKFSEPFRKLVTQGMVHGKTYSDPTNGRFLKPDEVDLSTPTGPKIKATGISPAISFEKMSKSKYNGVDPEFCISKYGADVTRAHMLFAAPESEILEWEEKRITGISRWLHKAWRIVNYASGYTPEHPTQNTWNCENGDHNDTETSLIEHAKETRKDVTAKLRDASGLNTVVSDLIKFTNALDSASVSDDASSASKNNRAVSRDLYYFCTTVLVKMMAPLTPAFSEEAWQLLQPNGSKTASIFESSWPASDAFRGELASAGRQKCVVSINGKKRFVCKIPAPPADMPKNSQGLKDWTVEQAFGQDEGIKWLSNAKNKEQFDNAERIIVGSNIVNIVTKS